MYFQSTIALDRQGVSGKSLRGITEPYQQFPDNPTKYQAKQSAGKGQMGS